MPASVTPDMELSARLHDAGIRVVVMVTNRDDAVQVEANGADVIVAQGWEAGGHRSHFTKPAGDRLADIGTLVLVPEVADAVEVPVVAAGGVVDGRGLVAALALGASGVLMGSRFLLTRESTAPEAHKKRLLEERGESTLVTDRLTGRYARVLRNTLTDHYDNAAANLGEALPFPAAVPPQRRHLRRSHERRRGRTPTALGGTVGRPPQRPALGCRHHQGSRARSSRPTPANAS